MCGPYLLYHYAYTGKTWYGRQAKQLMKEIFGFFMLLASLCASAQRDHQVFSSQLMVIVSDLEKKFEFLKGELIEAEENDSLFATGLRLEGTKENSILYSSNRYTYQAIINDAGSKEGSELILKAWKDKLTAILKDSFKELGEEYHSEKDPGINGYRYTSETVTILLLQHKTEDGSYWINLVIKAK